MKIASLLFLSLLLGNNYVTAQYWQQNVEYNMEIDMNVETHQFTGNQKLIYQNNSPDTLQKVFYHLYYNAFQPGSMMDVRARSMNDPSRRIGDEILNLEPDEIGYHHINSLKHNGNSVDYFVNGTILEVVLEKAILPGQKAEFVMGFSSQIPIMIRRTGRNNAGGVDYTMSQWYPKMVEYDKHGWHANPYIGREFYGVWGNFDVKINIDAAYTIGSTGSLQNPSEIGHGYSASSAPTDKEKLVWHFKADNVHDFVWAADDEYEHNIIVGPNDMKIHTFYLDNNIDASNWDSLNYYLPQIFEIMNEHCGVYPYETFSVIQGGDGGMEYPMATVITGNRSVHSLTFVSIHEITHSWFYGLLASNESKYGWMDEGFTTYFSDFIVVNIFNKPQSEFLPGVFEAYKGLYDKHIQESMHTHSDHFATTGGYGRTVYYKGALTLNMIRYIVGDEVFYREIKNYFEKWKYKHPDPDDFKRVMEIGSKMELDWFFEQWLITTNTVDYAIKYLYENKEGLNITLEKKAEMPMPVEVMVNYKNGKQEKYYIPLRIMRSYKNSTSDDYKTWLLDDWPWTHPEYNFVIKSKLSEIESIVLDPDNLTPDMNRNDNIFPSKDVRFENKGKVLLH